MKLHNFTTPREREIISWRKFHLSTHYIIFNWISRFDLGFLSSRDRERKIAEFFMIFHGSERKQKKTFRDLWYWSYFINVFLASFSHRKNKLFSQFIFSFRCFSLCKLCMEHFIFEECKRHDMTKWCLDFIDSREEFLSLIPML